MSEKIFDLIKSNLKNRKMYVWILALVLIFLLIFPYIDANVFYFNRVNNRVEILTKLSEIDVKTISNNKVLMAEYSGILSDIEKQTEGSLSSIFIKETNETVNFIKFLTGGVLFWILTIACFFTKAFNSLPYRILGIVISGVLGVFFGWISTVIPTIITPLINYIGFPLILIIIVALLATSENKQTGGINK